MNCVLCGRKLTSDEIAITRKLINRAAEEFCCITCLAAKFSVSEEDIRRLIEIFRQAGCSLLF